MKKANQEETRLHNRRLVLSTIYDRDEISRVEIAGLTQLTRTTVSDIVAEFLETGLVIETGLAPSKGGKPATLLQVDENSHLLIGIDLAEQEFCGALVNLRGEIVQRLCQPIVDQSAEATLGMVFELIEQLLQFARQPVIGIGMGVPGLMDPCSSRVREAINLDWHNLPLGELIGQRFQLPIHLANDCQVAALGEYTFGQSKSKPSLLLIKVGQGVGAGVVLDGQLFHGDNAGAGEIGHIQITDNGVLCRCGNQGCLETLVSGPAILRQAQSVNQKKFRLLDDVIQAYETGDSQAIGLVTVAAETLGSSLAHLVSILNINHIVLAGNLTRFGAGVLQPLRTKVKKSILPALASNTEVVLSELGDDLVLLGAASLILKRELGLF
jgi:glucokinase-like ROK family protein